MKPSLVILAAGIGSRYGGLKQMESVGPKGETIIDYSVYDAIRAGFGKLVFVIRKDMDLEFRSILGAKYESRILVDYVYQELTDMPKGYSVPPNRSKPWGTAHAIMIAEGKIKENFGVINGDDYYGHQSFVLLNKFLTKTKDTKIAEYCMVGFPLQNTLSDHGTVSRGICKINPDNYLQEVIEYTRVEKIGNIPRYYNEYGQAHLLTGKEIVSMNMWGFTPSVLTHLKKQFIEFLEITENRVKAEYYITIVISELIEWNKARVKVLTTPDSWLGITYQEDREKVSQGIKDLIKQGIYPEKLW